MAFVLPWKDKVTLNVITMMMTKRHKWEPDSDTICGHQQTFHSRHQSRGGVEKMETVERRGHIVKKTEVCIYIDSEAGTTDVSGARE